jgi:hypothetical protein
MQEDYSFLQMALVGYKAQRQMIDEKIADIQKLLGQPSVQPTTNGAGMAHGQRRPMSAAAKRRIAAAQKKRWKAFHAKQGMSQPKAGASAKRLAALKKARAARAAKRAASKT